MWAIATRIRNAWSSALDPRDDAADRSRGQTAHSKIIIDACKPFAWKDTFPPISALPQTKRGHLPQSRARRYADDSPAQSRRAIAVAILDDQITAYGAQETRLALIITSLSSPAGSAIIPRSPRSRRPA